jgi:glycosyltransferase involved in cell wall biosynthesis
VQISFINTHDISGGAARATYRIFDAFRKAGHNCRLFCRYKQSDDKDVVQIIPSDAADILSESKTAKHFLYKFFQEEYINAHPTDKRTSLFSAAYPGYDLSGIPFVFSSDVIILSWTAFFQSPATISRLLDTGRPVIWLMHDEAPYTGGCHYTGGCENYNSSCEHCPQLADDILHYPKSVVADKYEMFDRENLHIVTPSRWLRDKAEKSRVFKNKTAAAIPNCLPDGAYTPQDKNEARIKLGIAPDCEYILIFTENIKDPRKGTALFTEAFSKCMNDPDFRDKVKRGHLKLLIAGNSDGYTPPCASVDFGYVRDQNKLALILSAADIFAFPSTEDNLPNVLTEAFACGTPAIGFNIGGVPEIIDHEYSGYIVDLPDTGKFAECIVRFFRNNCKTAFAEAAYNKSKTYSSSECVYGYEKFIREIISTTPEQYHTENRTAIQLPTCLAMGRNFDKLYRQSAALYCDLLLKNCSRAER